MVSALRNLCYRRNYLSSSKTDEYSRRVLKPADQQSLSSPNWPEAPYGRAAVTMTCRHVEIIHLMNGIYAPMHPYAAIGCPSGSRTSARLLGSIFVTVTFLTAVYLPVEQVIWRFLPLDPSVVVRRDRDVPWKCRGPTGVSAHVYSLDECKRRIRGYER